MTHPVAVITGGSRGIGASTALELARRGCNIAINYRSKEARALEVAAQVETVGRRCLTVQADLTETAQIEALAQRVRIEFGRVDHLILNAAGGLERDKDDSYAYALNVTANHALLDALLPIMTAGSSVVFVTSHPSHFYGRMTVLAGYERVASTKKTAEDTLRERIPDLAGAGVRLIVISGDLISGTINAKLMQREYPGLMDRREREVGPLPTVEEFSKAVCDAAMDSNLPSGETILIGSTSWETYDNIYREERDQPA